MNFVRNIGVPDLFHYSFYKNNYSAAGACACYTPITPSVLDYVHFVKPLATSGPEIRCFQ